MTVPKNPNDTHVCTTVMIDGLFLFEKITLYTSPVSRWLDPLVSFIFAVELPGNPNDRLPFSPQDDIQTKCLGLSPLGRVLDASKLAAAAVAVAGSCGGSSSGSSGRSTEDQREEAAGRLRAVLGSLQPFCRPGDGGRGPAGSGRSESDGTAVDHAGVGNALVGNVAIGNVSEGQVALEQRAVDDLLRQCHAMMAR